MSARSLLAAACLCVPVLAACDSSDTAGEDTDRVSGVWLGTIPFEVDTVLADQNYRIKADYEARMRFDLVHEDGLVWGQVTSVLDGMLIAREAGSVADTFFFSPDEPVVSQAYGTYLRPELEIDVPFGPYDEDLWTFEKVAGRIDLQRQVIHAWRFTQRNAASTGEFTFELPMSDATVSMQRQDGEEPNVPPTTTTTQIPGSDLLTASGARADVVLQDMASRAAR